MPKVSFSLTRICTRQRTSTLIEVDKLANAAGMKRDELLRQILDEYVKHASDRLRTKFDQIDQLNSDPVQ